MGGGAGLDGDGEEVVGVVSCEITKLNTYYNLNNMMYICRLV